MSSYTKLFILLIALMGGHWVYGQGSGINSPFTRFGIGDVISESPLFIRQMGGVGTSFLDGYHLNFDNPASLSHLRATGFDVGVTITSSQLSDANNSSSSWYGNMSYLSFAFPMRNPINQVFSNQTHALSWSMGFALMPHSRVSYDIVAGSESDTGFRFDNFSGSGGSYKALWANAIKYRNISLGVNLGGVFGKIDYDRVISFPEAVGSFNNEFNTSYSMRGLYAKFGLVYLLQLNKKAMDQDGLNPDVKSISFGLTYKPNVSLSTEAEINNLGVQRIGTIVIRDTLMSSTGVIGSGTLPAELGLGVTYYGGNTYGLSVDLRRTFWSNYRMDPAPETFSDTYRMALGGFWRPDYDDINSFFNRVSYKLGVYYEQDPRLINGDRISSYGLTFGLGMPLSWQRRFSNLDLGVTIGKRSVDNILSESFAQFTLGFTFNDSDWFIKRKFN